MNVRSFLKKWGQEHLLSSIHTKEEEAILREELLSFDEEALGQQKESFTFSKRARPILPFVPLKSCSKKEEEVRGIGRELLSLGKVAPLLLAAGEGTRLHYPGPKGCFPFYEGKTLFQIFCEKILKSQKKYGREFFFMIMISPLHRKEVVRFFEKNRFFGLKKEQVAFFFQDLLPFCDVEGKWFFNDEKKIAKGASGNGSVYKSFARANLSRECQQRGIEKMLLFPIDNPLADPLDEDLVGLQEKKNASVVLSAIKRPKKEEAMGVLAKTEGSLSVVEYMEIAKDEMAAFPFANRGVYSMSLSFFERAVSFRLPFHRVKKRMRFSGKEREFFKFERFIFDALPCSTKTEALLYPRSSSYAPLKCRKGKDGIASVRRALFSMERGFQEGIS